MTDSLTRAVQRYAEAYADPGGTARTPIAGLTTIRATAPSELQYAISRPLICLVLRGEKAVTTGARTLTFNAGDSLIINADVPTVSQITRASLASPYLSLVFDLNPAVIAELSGEMRSAPARGGGAVNLESTDVDVADAALRLMRLVENPASLPVLQAQRVRELHYWLLVGRHGAAIRRLGWPDGRADRIARAVSVLRSDFARIVPIDRLAAIAGMSPSAFHEHFKKTTSLSPLQFQKQLRLIEARRLMLAERMSSSTAAFAVGYESVPQFTREYGRMFGQPPVKDTEAARARAFETA